ncbi:hypothetical protein MRB53_036291 [Persea americana]|nr:hypothetical protein MRB53_042435 [Persea americana]KAJ8614803.1 hypothetical protein MRB53_036469 [Persea americana]KAJ8614878.1 hypothetical protein MRB53_036291 [Persea americana]
MTDKTRRVAPAQYEPQTEQSPPVCCREEEGAGPSLNWLANANREVDGRTNGSGIDRFRADSWSCCLDYRRIRGAVLGNDFTTKTDAAAARRGSNVVRSCGALTPVTRMK